MPKFGHNDEKISFSRNSSVTARRNGMQFSGMIEDMMQYFLDYVINLHEVN
jgi:hypothetical protein